MLRNAKHPAMIVFWQPYRHNNISFNDLRAICGRLIPLGRAIRSEIQNLLCEYDPTSRVGDCARDLAAA
jgi:hypothetical protein